MQHRMELRFLLVLVFPLLFGAILLVSYGLIVRSQAAGLLNDLTALKVGKSTGTEVMEFAQRHQRQLFQKSDSCDVEACSMIFRVENTWLSKLRLEPLARFEVNFTLTNGLVDAIGAYLIRSMPIYPTFQGSAGDVAETVELQEKFHTSAHYIFPTPVGKPYLRVALDSHATQIERQHAFKFSLWCLVKPGGGCDLPCDYLPAAWKDWKESLFSNGLPVRDFDDYYPKNTRCSH